MTSRLHAYLNLVRLPNVFTAIADVCAGILYAGGGWSAWPGLLVAGSASTLLYSGGVMLNDVCDAAQDARTRPERPIPSGRISLAAARRLAAALLIVGWAISAFGGGTMFAVASILLLTILLYDIVLKATFLAPALMGVCRALNLLLGITAAGAPIDVQYASLPLLLMWLYVASITFLARTEAGVTSKVRAWVGAGGVLAAVCGLTGLNWIVPQPYRAYLVLVALFALLVAVRGLGAAAHPHPPAVQRAIKTFVLLIIIFDACVAWSARGAPVALVVAAWMLPAWFASKALRVT